MVIVVNLSEESILPFKSGVAQLLGEIKGKRFMKYMTALLPLRSETAIKDAKMLKQPLRRQVNLAKYRLTLGSNKIITAWNTGGKQNNEYYYPYSTEKHIFNFLKIGSINELMESVNNFFAEIREKNLSYDNILQIINQLTGGVVKYMLSGAPEPDWKCSQRTKTLYQHLSTLETLDEIQRWVKNIFASVAEYTKSASPEKPTSIS